MFRFIHIYVVGMLLIGGAVRAQEALPGTTTPATTPAAPPATALATPPVIEPEVSLDELIRRALATNPQLPAARHSQDAARLRLEGLKARPNPTLELIPGIGPREAADEEIILAQPLDVFGKRRARAGVAQAELRRAQAETTLAERALVVAVKSAAAELFAAQEAETLGTVQVEVAQAFRDAAARRAQLGDVPPVQVQRADLELLRAQNELTNARAERLGRRAVLNQLVGQAPETPLRVALPIGSPFTDLLRLPIGALPPGAPRPGPVAPVAPLPTVPTAPAAGGQVGADLVGADLVNQRAPLVASALTNRPDILGAQATLEARRATVESLRRERKPDIEIQARRSAFFGREGSYALRAVVTLPVFDFGSLKADRRAAQAETKAQEAQIALLRSQASAQVEQALVKLEQQRQTVERYRTGILPLTIDLLRKTQIGYNAGASTYLEVLEAQRTLRQVQTEYLQALVGVRAGETALESALGATPPANLTGTLMNPAAPSTPPGVAAPGTVPGDVIPPNVVPNPIPPAGGAPVRP